MDTVVILLPLLDEDMVFIFAPVTLDVGSRCAGIFDGLSASKLFL